MYAVKKKSSKHHMIRLFTRPQPEAHSLKPQRAGVCYRRASTSSINTGMLHTSHTACTSTPSALHCWHWQAFPSCSDGEPFRGFQPLPANLRVSKVPYIGKFDPDITI